MEGGARKKSVKKSAKKSIKKSTKRSTACVRKIQVAIRACETALNEWELYGTGEDKPRALMKSILKKALSGKHPTIPYTGHGWKLHDPTIEINDAGTGLSQVAKNAVNIIHECGKQTVSHFTWFRHKF